MVNYPLGELVPFVSRTAVNADAPFAVLEKQTESLTLSADKKERANLIFTLLEILH